MLVVTALIFFPFETCERPNKGLVVVGGYKQRVKYLAKCSSYLEFISQSDAASQAAEEGKGEIKNPVGST